MVVHELAVEPDKLWLIEDKVKVDLQRQDEMTSATYNSLSVLQTKLFEWHSQQMHAPNQRPNSLMTSVFLPSNTF